MTNLSLPFKSEYRILVVDDNKAIHEDFIKILTKEQASTQNLELDEAFLFDLPEAAALQFVVNSAYQGAEGLAMVTEALSEHRPYSLAFVDVRMPPGWDGVETIERLWEVDPSLQVVMCTAYSDYSWHDMRRRLGRSDNLLILKKPFDNIEVSQLAYALTRKWDVSQQVTARHAALLSEVNARVIAEERYALAARGTNDGIWDWDLEKDEIYFSPRWKAMLGYSDDEIGSSPEEWLGRVHSEQQEVLRRQLRFEGKDEAHEFISEHRVAHKDGRYRWMLSRGAVLRGPDGKALRIAGSQTDVTQNKAFDVLTALPNRVLFAENLARSIERCKADTAQRFAVMFIDLDRFKNINDSLGHAAGDELLLEVARRLEAAVRDGVGRSRQSRDTVARFGGDEFALLVGGVESEEGASLVASRILAALAQPLSLQGKVVFPSASIGIALWSPVYQTPQEMLRDADTAMYQAKQGGRSRCACFDWKMRAEVVRRLELESDLRRAVSRDEFTLRFQPRFRLATNQIVGFEALIRWQHPERGLLLPSQFIPLAEEIGLIVPIGEYVLRESCKAMMRCKANRDLELNVNLSPRQFREPALVDRIASVLRETGFDPRRLKLEITESVLVDSATVVEALNALRAMDLSLVIDDFGTGYSCLSYLSRLPCESLKIDKSFVSKMLDDIQSMEVVRAIISLASNLGMSVTAEGIETDVQANLLLTLGCEFGQGYYLAKPLPEEEAFALLQEGHADSLPKLQDRLSQLAPVDTPIVSSNPR